MGPGMWRRAAAGRELPPSAAAPRGGDGPRERWAPTRGGDMRRILQTTDDGALTLLRLTAGVVLLGHGVQKLLGWFGGHGAQATVDSFQEWFGLPPAISWLVVLSDSFGSLLLLLGLATRLAAAGAALVMLGAIWLVHGRWGFYMNWYSQPRGEGFEFHLLVLGILAVLLWRGGGRASLDGWLWRRLPGSVPPA